jgi:hypothetical protein
MPAFRMALGPFAALALLAGCSQVHGTLSDTPDTTSLGVAGGLGEGGVSTAYGIHRMSPDLKGVDTNSGDRNTSSAQRPPPLVPGTQSSPDAPRTSNDMQSWTSGPNLPVEPANMALEAETPSHSG